MPVDPQVRAISELVAQDCRAIFGDDLISVILYGSSLTPEYIPKKSDLNYLIVLSEEGIFSLHLTHRALPGWRKKKVATPLFLTRVYIYSSLDTFPIEFLNIKRNHLLISGEDILENLSFNKDHVRLQCERELKGKLLLLRERYVETEGKPKALRELLSASVPTFIFIFKGLLYLVDQEIPATKRQTVGAVAERLNLDGQLFSSLLDIREGALKPSAGELEELCRRYLKEIRSLALKMDERDFGGSPNQASYT